MTSDRFGIDGYVGESLYPGSFHPQFSPGWSDRMLVRHGFVPPRAAREAFTLIDLGCGDGFGLILNAACYPEAMFVGIDAMPGHIARGRDLAARIGLDNIRFDCLSFAEACASELPQADYATAQGVLSWISPANQQALLGLATRSLKPGGVLTIGYNCLPGWAHIAPFQRLVRAIADGLEGDPAQRFAAAREKVRASGAVADSVFAWLDDLARKLPGDYFAHEYLNAHWNPLWSADAIALVEAHGLEFAGQAEPLRLRPDFCFRKAERDALAGLSGPARALAADVFHKQSFRSDLFVKPPCVRIDEAAGSARWRDGYWAARCGHNEAVWAHVTPAGTIRFDNEAARAIMAGLQDGPAPLRGMGGLADVDLLNTADALLIADLIRPAEPPCDAPRAAAANAVIRAEAEAGHTLNGLAGRNGPVPVPRDLSVFSDLAAIKRGGR